MEIEVQPAPDQHEPAAPAAAVPAGAEQIPAEVPAALAQPPAAPAAAAPAGAEKPNAFLKLKRKHVDEDRSDPNTWTAEEIKKQPGKFYVPTNATSFIWKGGKGGRCTKHPSFPGWIKCGYCSKWLHAANVSSSPSFCSQLGLQTTSTRTHLKGHGVVEEEDSELKGVRALSDAEHHRLVEGLAQWIAIDMRPLSIVEDKGFLHFMKRAVPAFKVPCRRTITAKVGALRDSVVASLVTLLKDVPSVALTTDGWSSRKGRHYMGVTAHWLDMDFVLQFRVLAVRQSRGARLTGLCLDGYLTHVC
jgi:hypothetical protein